MKTVHDFHSTKYDQCVIDCFIAGYGDIIEGSSEAFKKTFQWVLNGLHSWAIANSDENQWDKMSIQEQITIKHLREHLRHCLFYVDQFRDELEGDAEGDTYFNFTPPPPPVEIQSKSVLNAQWARYLEEVRLESERIARKQKIKERKEQKEREERNRKAWERKRKKREEQKRLAEKKKGEPTRQEIRRKEIEKQRQNRARVLADRNKKLGLDHRIKTNRNSYLSTTTNEDDKNTLTQYYEQLNEAVVAEARTSRCEDHVQSVTICGMTIGNCDSTSHFHLISGRWHKKTHHKLDVSKFHTVLVTCKCSGFILPTEHKFTDRGYRCNACSEKPRIDHHDKPILEFKKILTEMDYNLDSKSLGHYFKFDDSRYRESGWRLRYVGPREYLYSKVDSMIYNYDR